MNVADFDFFLPPDRIAQHPARPRDAARLLHVQREALHDRAVRDLPALLRPGDILVANDTRVIPAQLAARRGDARIGITLNRPQADGTWHALARNARRLRAGDTLQFEGAEDFTATVRTRDPDGGVVLKFDAGPQSFRRSARAAPGRSRCRPISRGRTGRRRRTRPTIRPCSHRMHGAVAAPTAGLHFTPALLDALAARGVARATVTLHVGAGTFLPMRAATLTAQTHACRARRDHAGSRRGDQRRARGGRAHRRGRHDQPAAAGDRGRRRRARVQPFAGETEPVHPPRPRLPHRRRCC